MKKKNKRGFGTFYCIHADDVAGNGHWIDVAGSDGWAEHCSGVCCAWERAKV